jgi:hypothetical protein
MKDRIIKVYCSPELPPLQQYYKAYALDEDDNLVWVSSYTTDDPVLLDEVDDWYGECVNEIPDVPVPLNKYDYNIDYDSKDGSYIGDITLRYTNG